MKVHHLALQVQDLERARAFYVDVLGLPELRRQPHSIWVDAEGTIVMLERGPEAARPGLHAVAFGIARATREDWRRKLTDAGFPVEKETSYTLYVRDPDGTCVALSCYPD